MHQLTVDTAHTVTVTDHADREEAHGQLMRHVVRGDYYLRTIQTGPAHTMYELLALATDRRRPRSAGHATIEELTVERVASSDPPEVAARAAQRWIAHHRPAWDHGPHTDQDAGYPTAVLTAARAEARGWFGAGFLLPEAARLAAADPIPRLALPRLEALRRSATVHPGHLADDLADVVVGQLPSPPCAATVATLIWWYALLSWGASAP